MITLRGRNHSPRAAGCPGEPHPRAGIVRRPASRRPALAGGHWRARAWPGRSLARALAPGRSMSSEFEVAAVAAAARPHAAHAARHTRLRCWAPCPSHPGPSLPGACRARTRCVTFDSESVLTSKWACRCDPARARVISRDGTVHAAVTACSCSSGALLSVSPAVGPGPRPAIRQPASTCQPGRIQALGPAAGQAGRRPPVAPVSNHSP
jgi:hypothetical protein